MPVCIENLTIAIDNISSKRPFDHSKNKRDIKKLYFLFLEIKNPVGRKNYQILEDTLWLKNKKCQYGATCYLGRGWGNRMRVNHTR